MSKVNFSDEFERDAVRQITDRNYPKVDPAIKRTNIQKASS